jgi:hypothetical protein
MILPVPAVLTLCLPLTAACSFPVYHPLSPALFVCWMVSIPEGEAVRRDENGLVMYDRLAML